MFKVIKSIVSHFIKYECVSCGVGVTPLKAICFECVKEIGQIDQSSTCEKCGRYCLAKLCYFCVINPPLFTQARAFCVYTLQSAKIIKHFKYHNNTLCGDFMFQKMLHIVNTHFHNIDIIAPVPMNFFKEWWKGYNHSDKIAQRLAKSLRLVCLHLLSKKFFIKRQAVSSRAERLVNIKNVFILNTMYDIKGKNILLIDDITTTGATANECAKVLLNAGARNVFLLTFAKSITDEEIL